MPTPRITSRSGARAWRVAPAMARRGGVRSWRASTPVARSSPGAAWDTAPRVEKASGPTASATHKERNPSSWPRRATSRVKGRPSPWRLAAVRPMGTEAAGIGGARERTGPGPSAGPHPQPRAAPLDAQRATGERIGRVLVDEGIITEIQLVQALAAASGVDFVDLSERILDPSACRRIPEPFARRSKAVPIAWDDDRLVVAMVNPSDVFTLDDIRTMSGVPVKPVMAEERQLVAALESVWRNGADAEAMLQLASDELDEDDGPGTITDTTADAPVVQFVNELLTRAVHERASDIHLEPTGQNLRVRFRVDGVTHDVMNVPRQLQAPVISRLKIMGDINIAEHRLPQDGRVTMA